MLDAMKPNKIRAKAKPKPSLPKGIDSRYELEYLRILERQKSSNEIHDFYLKPGSLRMGTGTHYEPDFMVIANDGTIEYHEIKGHTRFAAKGISKLKSAAYIYPCFRFMLCMGESVKIEGGKPIVRFAMKEIE